MCCHVSGCCLIVTFMSVLRWFLVLVPYRSAGAVIGYCCCAGDRFVDGFAKVVLLGVLVALSIYISSFLFLSLIVDGVVVIFLDIPCCGGGGGALYSACCSSCWSGLLKISRK